MPRDYAVYIVTNRSGTLYTGVTNDLTNRVFQHKTGMKGFTARYKLTRLVYFETFAYVNEAIYREKQIKGWLRKKKVELITSMNPKWEDFAADWFSKELPTSE